MVWVRIDDTFPRGRKVKRAARLLQEAKGARGGHPRARVLAVFTDMTAYCNAHSRGGFFPDDEVGDLPDHKPLDVLTAMCQGSDDLAPLLIRHDDRGVWEIVDYAETQPTRESLEQRQKKWREEKQAQRDRVRADNDQTTPTDSTRTRPVRPKVSDAPGPTRPDPLDQTQDQEQAGRPAAARLPPVNPHPDGLPSETWSPRPPQENQAVLGRLAHEVLRDIDAGVVAPEDASEATKSLAAQHDIAYGGDRTRRALDAAEVRRHRDTPSDGALRIAEIILRQAPGRQMGVKAFQSEVHKHAQREWPDETQAGFRVEVVQILWRLEWYRLDQQNFAMIGTTTDPTSGRTLLKPVVGAYRWVGGE